MAEPTVGVMLDRTAMALQAVLDELRHHVPNDHPARVQARKALDEWVAWSAAEALGQPLEPDFRCASDPTANGRTVEDRCYGCFEAIDRIDGVWRTADGKAICSTGGDHAPSNRRSDGGCNRHGKVHCLSCQYGGPVPDNRSQGQGPNLAIDPYGYSR